VIKNMRIRHAARSPMGVYEKAKIVSVRTDFLHELVLTSH
jgi:hypothetical protein